MGLEKPRIENLLIATAQAGSFHRVTWDTTTKQQSVDTATVIAPADAIAHEIRASFDLPERNRRSHRRDRTEWIFELRLGFNGEVTIEQFEQDVLADPPRLKADKSLGLRQVDLELQTTRYTHPPQQNPSSGTRAILTFAARLWPL